MFKKRIFAIITAIALTVLAAGAAPVVADALGLSVTSEAHACGPNGGGC